MPQIVSCSACSASFSAPDHLAGKAVRCPKCKQPIRIPGIAPASGMPRSVAARQPVKLTAPAPPIAAASTPPVPPPSATAQMLAQKPRARVVDSPSNVDASAAAFLAGSSSRLADDFDDDDFKLAPETPLPTMLAGDVTSSPGLPSIKVPTASTKLGSRRTAVERADAVSRTAQMRPRFLYWTFALTMLPLAFSLLGARIDYEEKIKTTIETNPQLVEKLEELDESSDEQFFALLPEGKLAGSHLPRDSAVHWLYAMLSAATFLGLIYFLFERGEADPIKLLVTGITTATVGILLLIAFQFIAEWSQGIWLTRGNWIIMILFYIVKFIGFSYNAALNPENGFLLSWLGYTCGVGFCEELVKIAPVLLWISNNDKLGWRAACVLGLASGVGFGVAEGIMYSTEYYNGIVSFDTYLVRFISCVALHAVWSGAAAVMMSRNQAGFDTTEWSDWLFNLIYVIGIPVIFHGLYDTLLKKELNGYALVVALASFGWLILMIERSRGIDREEAEDEVPIYASA